MEKNPWVKTKPFTTINAMEAPSKMEASAIKEMLWVIPDGVHHSPL